MNLFLNHKKIKKRHLNFRYRFHHQYILQTLLYRQSLRFYRVIARFGFPYPVF